MGVLNHIYRSGQEGFLQKMTIKLQPHDEQEVSWEEEGEECFGQKVRNVRR